MNLNLILLLLGAYLLGGIPFGVLVARAHGVDIMAKGSGNTGATNVIRVLGKGPGLLVFCLDLLKGLTPALVGRLLFPSNQEIWFFAGLTAVVGHSLSPFLKFRGGKGISTALGMALGSSPIVALIAFLIFATVLAIFSFVSLASIIAVLATPFLSFFLHDSLWVTGGFALLAVFVLVRHRTNIQRLRNGTESKFTFGKKGEVNLDSERPATKEQNDDAP